MDEQHDNKDCKGRCISCGFAAKRTQRSSPTYPSLAYFEISESERQERVQFDSSEYFSPSDRRQIKTQLACFVQAAELHDETSEIQKQTERPYYIGN